MSGANLVLFDFDDTLVCSTWLLQQVLTAAALPVLEFDRTKHSIFNELVDLDKKAVSILCLGISKGVVKIVSNAEHAW